MRSKGGAGPISQTGNCYESCILFSVFSFTHFLFSFVLVLFFIRCNSQGYWDNLPDHVKPNTNDLLTLLMKSKADSTVKRCTKEIVKFSRRCNLSSIQPSPPFSVSVVIAYLHKVYPGMLVPSLMQH